MISKAEFDYLHRIKEFGGEGPRASGKTFRNLLVAAHAASVGDRITVWCHTEFVAQTQLRNFMVMYSPWGFVRTTPNMVKQNHSGGIVLFYGLPAHYAKYLRTMRGNNTQELFDI